ncbi:MAG: deoxyguanosinetriphosphate triphosphohydrolase [bacterium]
MKTISLAPYAVTEKKSKGRDYPEEEHSYRSAFQRDRDRIIHSTAFRRLEYKTQVFVYHEGDLYRTRLTHTLEVAQIARTIARALNLNEDLAETIALAHDLGHSPFGHAGEDILNTLMQGHGGFEHNQQSLRIVEHIEYKYPKFRGLNLTWEVREGMCKHKVYHNLALDVQKDQNRFPSLEAQVVNRADEIAYNNHDLDDGLTSGILSQKNLGQDIDLWKDSSEDIKRQFPEISPKLRQSSIIRSIINRYVTDLIDTTNKRLTKNKIKTLEDVRLSKIPIVAFSKTVQAQHKVLKEYLWQNMYTHYRVRRMEKKAQKVVADIFLAYQSDPGMMPPQLTHYIEKEGKERIICDYIAGMTDRFTLQEHRRLFDPEEKV